MNRKLAARRTRQFFARIGYYGIGYVKDYIGVNLFKKKKLPSVEKKTNRYSHMSNEEIIKELPKWYHATTGDRVDLLNPVTFTQKIQWYKIYDLNPDKTLLSDKYLVRDWVKGKIGDQYLTPLIGAWNSFDEIDFSSLPQKFALKCTHGTRCNIIVDNKDTLDLQDAKKRIDTWMHTNYAFFSFEMQYRDIVPRIIAEEYMENAGGEMYDYKFYCYDGKVRFIQFLSDRKDGLRMAYFDPHWQKQAFANDHPMIMGKIEKPDNLDEMIYVAETLSKGFIYVRVDLYRLNDGTIRFGEMTFTPAGGSQNFMPPEADVLLGKYFRIPDKKENK